MNPQYALDPAFLSCVTRHMDEHEPFGDIPRKVASSVRRAVVAVRAMARALHSASEIADEMRKVSQSENEDLRKVMGRKGSDRRQRKKKE